MPAQTEEAPPISSLSDDELIALSKSSPPLHELSDEDLLGVAVNQGLMQPDQANLIITQRKAAARAPVADAIADTMQSSPILPAPAFLTKAILTKGGRAGDIAAEVAGPILGGFAGTTVNPGVGTAVGGAAGGAAGDAIAQARQYLRGERDDFSKGELIGSAVAGGIPLGNTALTKPLAAIGKRALQGAGVAGVADVTQQAVDQKPFDWAQLGQSLVGGALFGAAGGATEVGIPKLENLAARKQVLAEIRKTPEFSSFKGSDAELTEAVRAKLNPQPSKPLEPVNVTGTGEAAAAEPPATEAEARAAAMHSKAPPPEPLAPSESAGQAAEAPRPLQELSDAELRALAKETAPTAPAEPIPPHQAEVAAAAVSKGLLEEPPTRGPTSLALQAKYPELQNIRENQTPIEIKRADGSIYPATISGFADDTGKVPWIGRLTDYGWTHGHLKEGESIATPLPTPEQWNAGMREVPAKAPETAAPVESGLAPLPEGAQVQYLGRKHLVMEGIGEPTDQWQVKMPGESGPGRTVTAEHLAAEGFQAPQVESPHPVSAAPSEAPEKVRSNKLGVGLSPDGTADLLSTIEELGGVRSPKSISNKGGEYDGFVEAFHSGPQKMLIRQNAGNKIDDLLEQLNQAGYNFRSVDELYQAVAKAEQNRKKLTKALGDEQYGSKFDDALFHNKSRKVHLNTSEPISADDLSVGDEFNVRGEPVKVTDVDISTGEVRIEDGLTRTIPPGTVLYPDRGEVRKVTPDLTFGETVETHAMGGSSSRSTRAPAASFRSDKPAAGRPEAPVPQTPIPDPPNDLVRDLQRVQRLVAPQTIDSAARFTANLLRELNSKMANEMVRADHSLRQYRNSFDLTPVPKNWKFEARKPLPRNYAFIDAYEGGRFSGLSPKEYEAAKEFRKQNEALVDRVHALGTGALKTFYENYFPHIWNDPTKARQVMASILAKRPLEGSKSFLQQRTHQLFTDGLEAGLTPVHDNPIDLWLLKKREVERYILGQSFVKEMKQAGLLKFVHAFSQKPEGYSTVNDRAFTVYGPPTVTIQEAFDAGMREKTLQALEALGVPHERVASLGGNRWGVEENIKGVPGSESIKTKFGGPDSVIWHELGHALDSRYPELRGLVMATPKMKNELRALADLRAEGQTVSGSHRKYLRSTPEKMATILQAYLHAPDKMESVAPSVKAAFTEFLNSKPELSVINEISPTLRIGSGEMELPVGGQVKLGNWYMPDPAAQVMNNFLSPGLNSHLWYRSLREVSNFMNSAQLSLSAFHLGFTSIDAIVSNFALSLEDAYNKQFGAALKGVLSTPLAPVTNFIKGNSLRNAMLKAGDVSDDQLRQLVAYVEKGGGRAGQDPFFDGQMARRMTRAFALSRDQIKSGDFLAGTTEATKTLVYGVLGALEKTMTPIHAVVVRQKLGVIAGMAARDIRRLGPDATPADIRSAAGKSIDSASNRMGQMEYDNMMMNRVVKDSLLLAVRSAGWQLGKVREGGGAILDAADFVRAKATGQSAEPSRRMFYVVSLVAVTGVMGAMINYLYTGEGPKSARDCFQPRTGEIDDNGNAVRINLPTYLKDVFAFYRHPVTSGLHALAPYISAASDLLANRDYYGYQIRNPDDPLWKQGSDVAKWASSEIMPFSVSGALQLHKNDSPVVKMISPFIGLTPVSTTETMTPAQELAREIMHANMPQRPLDRNKYDKNKYLKDIIQQVKMGHPEAGKKMLADGLDKGILDPNTSRLLMDRLKYTPLQYQVHHFTPDASMRVFRIASPDEKNQLRGIITVKVLGSKTISPAVKATYLSELQSRIPAARAAGQN